MARPQLKAVSGRIDRKKFPLSRQTQMAETLMRNAKREGRKLGRATAMKQAANAQLRKQRARKKKKTTRRR